ncbi:cupin domain-containing protein [Hyphomicrobium sp.]|uniref:cupin domain-containing protein n=1 Tax=Hyphomicrobium sp. TaxID=82 RepID=UPI002FE12516
MKHLWKLAATIIGPIALTTVAASAVIAQEAGQPAHAHEQAAPRETITTAFNRPIPNIPGKSIVGLIVSYPPGGKTPAHIHPKSAFVNGFVVSGAIRSKVDDGETKVFKAGESWSERPGAHHPISDNASETEPATLLAIFVVDTNDKDLVTLVDK